jgi:hypothetical protein
LEFLVQHIEEEIYNAKLDKSIELKSSSEMDKLDEYSSILRARERDLEKICEKTNGSSYELSKKLDVIRALRSERTIVSELLDKIERELCNLEHCYKVLVIERTIDDHDCQEKLDDFRRLEQSAQKQMDRAASLALPRPDREEEQFKMAIQPAKNELTHRRSMNALSLFEGSQGNQRLPSQQELGKDR